MGLFGPSKIKTTPKDFVKTQLDKIFSADFTDAEQKGLANLSKDITILQSVNPDKYLRERQNVVYNLFQIAWDRNTSHAIFIEYSSIMLDDPRIKAINSGVYDMCLSNAQQAGMDTFGFISRVFIAQIIPQGVDINDSDYSKLHEIYGTDFTSLYMSCEALIKQHRFLT
jgi:hypothetical protein